MAAFGFGNIMGKVQEMQENMRRLQEEMAQRRIEAASGGGMVAATVNGRGDLLEIKIDPNLARGDDIELLEDLVKAAVNAAVAKSQEELKAEMAKVTGGLNLPGLDQLGGMFG